MRLQRTHKHVRYVVPLLLAPLQQSLIKTIKPSVVWCNPSSCLTLPPKHKLPRRKSLKSSNRMLSKKRSSPFYYHSFTSWSGWPAVSLLQPSLYRQQNSALIKISWRWMSHIKNTSFVAPHDSADRVALREYMLAPIKLFITSVRKIISNYGIKISPFTSELLITVPALHTHAVTWACAILVCLGDYVFLSCWVLGSLPVFIRETLSPARLVQWTGVCVQQKQCAIMRGSR